MIQQTKKGFTLIELLVVITIIGILATWAVAVYTGQIQKARDTTRLNDIKALQSWVEQFYQDKTEYPWTDSAESNYFTWVITYVPKLPKDPKSWQLCAKWTLSNSTACDYMYTVSEDINWIINWEYKISTWFENAANVSEKAAKDWGLATEEPNRYEIWLNLSNEGYVTPPTDLKSTVCDRTDPVGQLTGVLPVDATNCLAAIDNALLIAGN